MEFEIEKMTIKDLSEIMEVMENCETVCEENQNGLYQMRKSM